MKKVIFIHNNYEPEHFPTEPDAEERFYTYGFGSNLARNFKKYFPQYEIEMWRLDSFCGSYYENEVQDVFFRIFPSVRINKFGEISLKFISELKKEIKRSHPVLFVSHTHTWLLYQISLFFKNSPIITSHHGDWSPFFKIKQKRGLKKIKDFADILMEKMVMKNVDCFMVCDYNQIPYIKKVAPEGNFIIHSNGLNTQGFIPVEKSKAREILKWDNDKKYILYVGRLYDLKQSKELIDIWVDIKKEHPGIELVIIGNTESDEYYSYALNSGAMTLGRILNKDLSLYYSASDVYVLMALRDDYFGGTGIAPLESLACNTPVVSYAMRNYVGDNIQEIGEVPSSLDEYKEAILKVINSSQLYKNMRESVEKYYSHEKMAEKIELAIKQLKIN